MKIDHYVAVVDTCVLAPMPVADTMLRLANETFYTPKWSVEILTELKRTLEKFGYTEQQSERRLQALRKAFPEALVAGYEDLIPVMKNHEKDRHVLAAAVRCKAHCVVTANTRHFPNDALAPYDLECLSPDDFLVHQYHLDTDGFMEILANQANDTKRSFPDLITTLSKHVPKLVAFIKP